MSEVIRTTFAIYKNYGGSSMMTVFVIAAIVYLWITEEKKEIKILFVYLTAVIGALFFFPLFAYVAMHFFLDSQVYYRLLWLVPMGMIVSYAAVKVISQIELKRKRALTGILIALFIMQSGSLVYCNPMVTKTENLYHLPASVISVADVMHVEGRDVKAVVPGEMLQFIRQYDASIHLAYGREALVDGWSNNPLYEAMEKRPIHSFELTDYARQQGVEYIVLRAGTPIVGSKPIEKYQFSYLATVENYDIYINDMVSYAEEKKSEYASKIDSEREDNYMQTAPLSDGKIFVENE